MSDGLGLGYSKIGSSEFKRSGWDRLRRAGLFLVAFVFMGMFFLYLTREVQMSTGHATNPDSRDETSR
jgi:hypothetical protein